MKYLAISQRVQVLPDIKERRDALSQEWSSFAVRCGFLPILLPNCLEAAKMILSGLPIGGILLTGGNDLASYGGDAPERDEVEHFLVTYAITQQIPILGVCRGMQLLLDHFGMPLERVENHVRIEHSLNNGDTVNSYHSFGVKQCSSPLKALCWSEDGVVESVMHEDFPWVCGIMWHPERYHPFRERDIAMIKEMFQL